MVPSESDEVAEENSTASGRLPEVGVATGRATGATFAAPTLTETVVDPVSPESSVRVSLAVLVPEVA